MLPTTTTTTNTTTRHENDDHDDNETDNTTAETTTTRHEVLLYYTSFGLLVQAPLGRPGRLDEGEELPREKNDMHAHPFTNLGMYIYTCSHIRLAMMLVSSRCINLGMDVNDYRYTSLYRYMSWIYDMHYIYILC